jgi:hypothetical protein
MLDYEFIKLRGEERYNFNLEEFWKTKEEEFVGMMEQLRIELENLIEEGCIDYSCKIITEEEYFDMKDELIEKAKLGRTAILNDREEMIEKVTEEYRKRIVGCQFVDSVKDEQTVESFQIIYNELLRKIKTASCNDDINNEIGKEILKNEFEKATTDQNETAIRAIIFLAETYGLKFYSLIQDCLPFIEKLIRECDSQKVFHDRYYSDDERVSDMMIDYRPIDRYRERNVRIYYDHEVTEAGLKIRKYKEGLTIRG